MRFEKVRLAAIGVHLPDEVLTSSDVEQQLAPVYERLRLPEGRLELMTGIRERRLCPAGPAPVAPASPTGMNCSLLAGSTDGKSVV